MATRIAIDQSVKPKKLGIRTWCCSAIAFTMKFGLLPTGRGP